MGVLGAKGGNLMKSYWAMILAARYANKNTSHALSIHLVLPEREFWDATHTAWREIGSLRISFFFFFSTCSPLAQGELYAGNMSCLLIRHATASQAGIFREV